MKTLIIVYSVLLLSACGQQGVQGNTGPQGSPGNSNGCTIASLLVSNEAPNGGSIIDCGDTSSIILNGSNGSPGTVVAPVQFCPGVPSYPSTFPEVGFIINGSIYAVYSTNGGFMTLIPPGYYSSDGVGSSCNFTVNADNTITN